MARTATLSNLRTRVRRAANMESSQFVTDAEVTEYINESIAELYDLLIGAQGQDFFLKSDTFTTTAGVTSYPLSAPGDANDFFLLRGVDLEVGTDDWKPLKAFSFDERNYSAFNPTWDLLGNRPKYRLYGSAAANGYTLNMLFNAKPPGAYNIRYWYVPHAPVLSGDSDVWDGFNGWENFVVIDAAIKCVAKEESDATDLMRRRGVLVARIEGLAAARDTSSPEKVIDVEDYDQWL